MEPFDLRQWSGFGAAGGDLSQSAVIDEIVIDSRRVSSPRALFIALEGASSNGHDYVQAAAQAGARYALVRHGFRPPQDLSNLQPLYVDSPLHSLQQLAGLYRRQMKASIIAITGSRGKTMLKDMLQALLVPSLNVVISPESFNSQIGVALSLLRITSQHQVAIIEAGISKTGEMAHLAQMITPDHVAITTINEEHISTLGSVALIAAEKMQLAQSVPTNGWILLPRHHNLSSYFVTLKGRLILWDQKNQGLPHVQLAEADPFGTKRYIMDCPDGLQVTGQLRIGYPYLVDLMSIAIKAAWLMGIPSQQLTERLIHYLPESTQTEVWRAPSGVTLLNSPYCADPQSVDLALAHLENTAPHCHKHFVFGGLRCEQSREDDLRRIGTSIHQKEVDHLYLYGKQDPTALVQQLQSGNTQVHLCRDHVDALEAVKHSSHTGDHVLIKGPFKPTLEKLMELFDDGLGPNLYSLNLAAVDHNLALIRQHLSPHVRMMAMVKALAYGTEDTRMARFLASRGIDRLGVSHVDEGVALRRAEVPQTIFCLQATPYEVRKVVRWGLEVGVHDGDFITALAKEAVQQEKRIGVHLHIDTGMGRLGCRPEEAFALAQHICDHPSLRLEGLMTHFSCADDPLQDPFTKQQNDRLMQVHQELAGKGIVIPTVHAANSAAALRFPDTHHNMVRIGLALFGIHASPATKEIINLRLAVSLTSRVVGINKCQAGESVSYARSYRVQRPIEKIAVVPLGYFDGIHRHYSQKGWVMIRGQKAPMVGNICMDYLMVDVTHIAEVEIGDSVLIFGHDEFGQYAEPEELAKQGGSIAHELISSLGPRIQRVFIYE